MSEPVEWLWHVGEADRPLGCIERARAHAKGVRHRSGVVFLIDARERVYLTRRAVTKALWPGCLDTSASFHVTYGESYTDAAKRETNEELGLHCDVRFVTQFHHDDPPELQWVALFVAQHAGEPLTLDPTELAFGSFMTLDEAERHVREQPSTPWLRDGLPLLRTHWHELGTSRALPQGTGGEPNA